MLRERKDRLRKARTDAGFKTAAEAARAIGVEEGTYRHHENGTRDFGLVDAKRYATALKTTWQYLLDGDADGMSATGKIVSSLIVNGKKRTEVSQNPLLSEDKLKVLGLAECGPDGWATWNGEVVDWVARPANLAGAKDAYAVFIVGDSMEHRFHAGDIAFIHPGKPVTPGAYVLVQRKPKTAGDPPLAMIKRLVRRSGEKVTLEQHNPAKTLTVALADIVSMHRVVGSVEA